VNHVSIIICYSVALRYCIGTTLVFCKALSRVECLVVNYIILRLNIRDSNIYILFSIGNVFYY
jgi:hypothetical protein